MADNGSGTYSRPVSAYIFDTVISETDVNSEMDGIATALTNRIAKDGQTTTTARIPFASGIYSDTIAELTTATGVTVDGALLKDGRIDTTQGADIASATTTNLETATGNVVDVTGTTTITAITLSQGHWRWVRFTGILTLTHGSSLVLPGAADITTAAGDYALFLGYGSSVVRCASYIKASGVALPDPMTTRGDIIIRNASNVTARLAIGAANTAPVSDGTDVAYAAIAVLAAANTFTKRNAVTPVALTSSSNHIAIDMSLSNNFSHTFTEDTTLDNPSNPVAGTSGQIGFTQHASAAKTLAFGSQWIEAGTGSAPSVSTTTSAQNLLSYYVFDTTHIYYTLLKHGVS